MSERWRHNFLARGEKFHGFWKDYFTADRKVAYILAEGFDPRMCEALSAIRKAGWNGEGDCLLLRLGYGPVEKPMQSLVEKNRVELNELVDASRITENTINVKAAKQRGEGSRQAAILVRRFLETTKATDVIVDINAMPKSVGLSVLSSALKHSDAERDAGRIVNVHCVVSHNPTLDDRMARVDVQRDPFLLSGFLSGFESEDNTAVNRIIWMPILGSGQRDQLDAIRSKFPPTETCAAVPSPSVNPRKGDDLITEYQDMFIDEKGRFLLGNVLRVSERDPFEAYYELVTTIEQYATTYRLLDGCKVLLSSHSSKLLSVACLLAAYDAQDRGLCHGVSVAFVEAYGHRYDPKEGTPSGQSEFFEMWLAGDPYISKAD